MKVLNNDNPSKLNQIIEKSPPIDTKFSRTKEYIRNSERELKNLISTLSDENLKNAESDIFISINQLLEAALETIDGKRLQYNSISSLVRSLSTNKNERSEMVEKTCENIVYFGDWLLENNAKDQNSETEVNVKTQSHQDSYKFIMKIQDHLKLAELQYGIVGEVSESLIQSIVAVKDKSEESINVKTKEIEAKIDKVNIDLVSILAIFTGIAFVLFGGITAMSGLRDAVLASSSDTFLKVLAFSSLIGAAIVGALYMFFWFVLHITRRKEGLCWFNLFVGLIFIVLVAYAIITMHQIFKLDGGFPPLNNS